MRKLIKKYIINTVSIYLLSQLIAGISLKNSIEILIYSSFILTLLLLLVKPVVNLIMLPINLITFNLSVWVINIILTYLWIILVPDVTAAAWDFQGINLGFITIAPMNMPRWLVIITAGVVLSIFIRLFDWLMK